MCVIKAVPSRGTYKCRDLKAKVG